MIEFYILGAVFICIISLIIIKKQNDKEKSEKEN